MAAKLFFVLILQIVIALAASVPDQPIEGSGSDAPRKWSISFGYGRNVEDAPKEAAGSEKYYPYHHYYPYYRASDVGNEEEEEAPRKWHITFGYGRDDEEAAPAPVDEPVDAPSDAPADAPVDAPADAVEPDSTQ